MNQFFLLLQERNKRKVKMIKDPVLRMNVRIGYINKKQSKL